MYQRAEDIIQQLQLEPHPEGGYYKETYRSPKQVFSKEVDDERAAITDIYFLLTKGEVSKWHRVIHDEIWHFYEGDPLALYISNENEGEKQKRIIGSDYNYKAVVPGSCWQAAETLGEYSLVGCSVGAGFDFKDFELLENVPSGYQRLFKQL